MSDPRTMFANKITIQVNDVVRLVLHNERPTVSPPEPAEQMWCVREGEVVMSLQSARALRDLMVQYIKDEEGTQQLNS